MSSQMTGKPEEIHADGKPAYRKSCRPDPGFVGDHVSELPTIRPSGSSPIGIGKHQRAYRTRESLTRRKAEHDKQNSELQMAPHALSRPATGREIFQQVEYTLDGTTSLQVLRGNPCISGLSGRSRR
jgi:hypothetical protein